MHGLPLMVGCDSFCPRLVWARVFYDSKRETKSSMFCADTHREPGRGGGGSFFVIGRRAEKMSETKFIKPFTHLS